MRRAGEIVSSWSLRCQFGRIFTFTPEPSDSHSLAGGWEGTLASPESLECGVLQPMLAEFLYTGRVPVNSFPHLKLSNSAVKLGSKLYKPHV